MFSELMALAGWCASSGKVTGYVRIAPGPDWRPGKAGAPFKKILAALFGRKAKVRRRVEGSGVGRSLFGNGEGVGRRWKRWCESRTDGNECK